MPGDRATILENDPRAYLKSLGEFAARTHHLSHAGNPGGSTPCWCGTEETPNKYWVWVEIDRRQDDKDRSARES